MDSLLQTQVNLQQQTIGVILNCLDGMTDRIKRLESALNETSEALKIATEVTMKRIESLESLLYGKPIPYLQDSIKT